MPAFRTTLAALAFAGLALTGAPAQAQQSRESVKADVTAWGQAITSAFTPGYWEGQMQELDANGAVVNTEERPDCIKQGEYGKLGSSLSEMFMTIADMADSLSMSDYEVMDLPGPKPLEEVIRDAMKGFASAPVRGQATMEPVAAVAREIVGPHAWPALRDGMNAMMLLRQQPVILMTPSVIVTH